MHLVFQQGLTAWHLTNRHKAPCSGALMYLIWCQGFEAWRLINRTRRYIAKFFLKTSPHFLFALVCIIGVVGGKRHSPKKLCPQRKRSTFSRFETVGRRVAVLALTGGLDLDEWGELVGAGVIGRTGVERSAELDDDDGLLLRLLALAVLRPRSTKDGSLRIDRAQRRC